MIHGIDLFFVLFNNLALFIALVALYGYFLHKFSRHFWFNRQVIVGAVFGMFAIGCMYAKIPVFQGVIVDQRNAIMVLSGAFGGPASAIISAIFTGSFRAYLGGDGVIAGIIGVSLAGTAGIVLNRFKNAFNSVPKAAVSSLFSTIVILPGFLFVKDLETGWGIFKAMALPYGSAIFCGIFLVGLMLKKQEGIFQIEKNLKATQERLDFALTGSNQGLWDWDIKNNILHFDKRFYTIAGYAPDAFQSIAEEWEKRVHPDDLEQAQLIITKYLAGELKKFDIEFKFLRQDGDYMWLRSSGKIVAWNEKGEPTRFVGTHSDITKLKQLEKALRESQQNLASLLHNIQDGIVRIDRKFRHIFANPALLEAIGFSEEQYLGKTNKEIGFPEEVCSFWQEKHERVFKSKKKEICEYNFISADKEERVYQIVLSPEFNANHDVEAIVAIMRDITDLKRAEEEKNEIIKELEKALAEVKTLQGLIPICSHCKKIRDDKGYWNTLETYLEKHSGASFSHSLCIDCSDELYGKEDWYIKMRENKKRK